MRTPRMWLALPLAGILMLAGCSAGGDEDGAQDSSEADSSWQEEPAAAPEDAAGGDVSNDVDGQVEEPAADAGTDTGTVNLDEVRGEPRTSEGNLTDAGLVFITSATVGVQVDDPYPTLDQIADYAVDAGGGEVDRVFQAATEYEGARGSITVKLPPLEMNEAIEHLSTYGEVNSVQLHREEVGVAVTDLESRIRVAQMSVDRMEQWLETAPTRDEAFELEQMYNERLVELENLLSQQRQDTRDTALSTLTVEVYSPEAAPPEPPAPEPEPETGFMAGLTSGWNAFYEWGSDALRVLGVALPWLVFLGLLVVVAYYIARPIRRWREAQAPSVAHPVGPTTSLPPTGPPVVYHTGPAGQPAPVSAPASQPAPQSAPTTGPQPAPKSGPQSAPKSAPKSAPESAPPAEGPKPPTPPA